MATTREGPGDTPAGEHWLRGAASVAGIALAAILIVLVLMVGRSTAERDEAIARERRSYDIMLLTAGMSGAIGRAEAALGRFVISADRTVGTVYYQEWVDAGRQLARLERLTADDARERRIVAQVRRLFETRAEELSAPAGHANYKQYLSALTTFNDAGKKPTIGALSRALSQVEAAERTRLAERARQSARAAQHANLLSHMLSVVGILIVLLAIALGWLTLAALAERRRAREAADIASDRADWLEVAVAERTRELSAAAERLKAEMAEREAAEMQLRQVQKMEAVGQLTGGIAHDFNNMLAVVVGGLDLARRRLQQEADEVGRHIDHALEGANRAAALTRRLLSFARAEPLLPKATDPGALVSGMSDLLDRTLGERITVATRGLDGLWSVWVDGHQLENAILNLAVNARDAMEGEGRLLISTGNVTLAAGEIGEAAAGDYVCLSVVDDGCGMPAEVRERVFEPFFTTKPVGKGTGLGLSQIFGFVRQSGGEIAIDSVPGAGTAVSLYLPRYDGQVETVALPAEEDMAPVTPLPPAAEQSPTILVVEDDPRVLRATMDGLAELGQRAVSCPGGDEALALLAESPGISLLITDVLMPGMTGPELARRAVALYPHLSVLFVTGYVGDAGEAGDLASHAILRKPFTLAALERAVGQALSESSRNEAAAAAE